jgi:hypothetical protein
MLLSCLTTYAFVAVTQAIRPLELMYDLQIVWGDCVRVVLAVSVVVRDPPRAAGDRVP